MSPTILVVDDEDYIRRMVSLVLERDGHNVLLAATVEDGLKLLREAKPEVVTVDLMMPGQSGLDLLAQKRADPSISDIPSIVLTAVGIKADLEQAQALGATVTLNKPFSRQQLIDAIHEVLGE